MWFQSKSLFVGDFNFGVTVRGNAAYPLSFGRATVTTSYQSAIDCLIFSAAHKQAKLKVLFVKLICWVVDF